MRRVFVASLLILSLSAWSPLNERVDGSPYRWSCSRTISVKAFSATPSEVRALKSAVRTIARYTDLPITYAGTTTKDTAQLGEPVWDGRRYTVGIPSGQVVVGFEDTPIAGLAGYALPLYDWSYYRSGYVRLDVGDVQNSTHLKYLLLHELAHIVGADHHETPTTTEVMGVTESNPSATYPTRFGAEDRRALDALGCE